MTDEELVLLARQGDPDAFDQLVVRHQSAVYRAALAALRVAEDAEDVAQDAFVKAWSNLGRFRGDSSFKTWLLTIAWNQAMSRRRHLGAWFRRMTSIDTVAEPIDTAVRQQDATVHEFELQRQARRAIQALSPKLRDALLLAQSGDYAYEEIGAMLNVPVGTVKWRVSEARKKVRERLAEGKGAGDKGAQGTRAQGAGGGEQGGSEWGQEIGGRKSVARGSRARSRDR